MFQWIDDFIVKNWAWAVATIIIPIVSWFNKKRREYNRLESKVQRLEDRVEEMEVKFDSRFDKLYHLQEVSEVKREENSNKLWERLDRITGTLMEVKEDSAINRARLEERRKE